MIFKLKLILSDANTKHFVLLHKSTKMTLWDTEFFVPTIKFGIKLEKYS